MSKAIFCTVKTVDQAAVVVERLKVAGFANSDISVLMSDSRLDASYQRRDICDVD